VHEVIPALGVYVFIGHGIHAAVDVAPTVLLYVPAAHGPHEEAPGVLLTVPAGHGVHTPAPISLYVPIGHCIQVAIELPPVVPL
jgi:hypothetical protein